ncbi:MAG: hypothetical protein ACRDH9_09245 [Actinomycetota bacterium]
MTDTKRAIPVDDFFDHVAARLEEGRRVPKPEPSRVQPHEGYVCLVPGCQYASQLRREVGAHVADVHPQCPYCEHRYYDDGALGAHIDGEHPDGRVTFGASWVVASRITDEIALVATATLDRQGLDESDPRLTRAWRNAIAKRLMEKP